MTPEQKKHYDALPLKFKQEIVSGKRFTKIELGFKFPAWSVYNIYHNEVKRDEMVRAFNDRFGTTIK